MDLADELGTRILQGRRLWLFLDYDGTLAGFAPTPDVVWPDPELIQILSRLANCGEGLRVVILSGRRLSHIEKLVPVNGILRAGTYGIEYQTWDGERVGLLDFDQARPFLDQVKAAWSDLLDKRRGFYLEDKGFSLAIHARDAGENEARNVITEATHTAGGLIGPGSFKITGGHRFLEVSPLLAEKGQFVSMLLKRFPWPNADIVYFGDDDKDESAFKVVVQHGGTGVLVAPAPRQTAAQRRLENPAAVRRCLSNLADMLEHGAG